MNEDVQEQMEAQEEERLRAGEVKQ